MRYLKLLPALMLAFLLAACEPQNGEGDEAMDEAMQESEEAMDDAVDTMDDAMDDTGAAAEGTWESAGEESGEAWDETKEAAGEAWEATKETSAKAWDKTKEAFKGDMSPEEKAAFDECVKNTMEEMAATEEQAERGCWKEMQAEVTEDDAMDEGEG